MYEFVESNITAVTAEITMVEEVKILTSSLEGPKTDTKLFMLHCPEFQPAL